MTAALETTDLGKRYRNKWALSDCTLRIPRGHVVGLVGPNGSGKSTLLNLAAGLLVPSAGRLDVFGGVPARDATALGRVGFVAQEPPVYSTLRVRDHLRLGAHLNPGWDAGLANNRVEELGLDPSQRAGKLSGVSALSWRSPWPLPSGRRSFCSTSLSPVWTLSLVVSSSRSSWRQPPIKKSAWCCRLTLSPT